jgi:predicted Zn-dependent protease
MDDVEAARQAVGELEALDPDGYWPGRARVRLLWREGRLDEAEHELRALRTRWANLPWVHLLAVEFADATGREALGDESRDALRVLQR